MCGAKWHVRFTPNSDRESGLPQTVMSALPPIADMCSALAHVRFGSKADMCSAPTHVRFTPNSDRERGFPQKVMSALPLKADMCSAVVDVRFGPIADIQTIQGICAPPIGRPSSGVTSA
jgi:hypothetical protein